MNLKNIFSKNNLVLTHANADIDAISSLILFKELATKLKKNIKLELCYTQSIKKPAKKIIILYKTTIKKHSEIDSNKFQKLILIDMQPNNAPAEILSHFKLSEILVIDHHQLHPDTKKTKHIIDLKAVSTTEILYRLFKKHKIILNKKLASLIIYGLLTDTGILRFANNQTFEIINKLLKEQKLDYNKILLNLQESPEKAEKIAWIKAAQRAKILKKEPLILISKISSYESSCSQKLIVLGADISLIISKKPKLIRIIARANSKTKINLGKIFIDTAEKFKCMGGGHPAAAAINLPLDKEKQAFKYIIAKVKKEAK